VPEVFPGILLGYLPPKAAPNSDLLLPAPPAAGSAAFAADQDAFLGTRALAGTPRWALAVRDADLGFPRAAEAFSCTLNFPLAEGSAPHLAMLLRRTLTDAVFATFAAKNHYQRPRPFVVQRTSTCTPREEAELAREGSYPSGHASIGWAWALILAELAPERADAILKRGHAFGQSRVICGVHWQSDVEAGRIIGAAVVAKLHSDPVFRAEMEAARQELAEGRAGGLGPAADCGVEAAALFFRSTGR
jgi:acid phosphatase (class A)